MQPDIDLFFLIVKFTLPHSLTYHIHKARGQTKKPMAIIL